MQLFLQQNSDKSYAPIGFIYAKVELLIKTKPTLIKLLIKIELTLI